MRDHSLHRRHVLVLLGWACMISLAACGRENGNTQAGVLLNVEMYSYLNRPIHFIIFNGTDLGVMNAYGGTGTITGVRIPFGVQSLNWTLGGPRGMAGNGEQVFVKNRLVITPEQIPRGTRYLGLHLYPDGTADITFSDSIPDRTARGEKILEDIH